MGAEIERINCIENIKKVIEGVTKKKYTAGGAFMGTRKCQGYVSVVHDDPADELYGTVGVQEYEYDYPEGFHDQVLVSSLQNNDNGMYIMPSLYSDVVIVQDPVTLIEFVSLASHVDVINLRSHKDVMVGVVETEEFKEGDDDIDMQDLEETGKASVSRYDKGMMVHSVMDGEKLSKTETTTKEIIHSVIGSNNTTITQTEDKVTIEVNDSKVTILKDGTINIEGKKVNINADDITGDGKNVTLKGNSIKHNGGSQKMVLGDKLVTHLQQLIQQISTLTVVCASPGSPSSPPVNAGAISSISSQLQSDLSQKSTLD